MKRTLPMFLLIIILFLSAACTAETSPEPNDPGRTPKAENTPQPTAKPPPVVTPKISQ